jgi:hypothetical protein
MSRSPIVPLWLTAAAACLALSLPARAQGGAPTGGVEGVAVEIVYDTSGSMADAASDGAGGRRPKCEMATKALGMIVDRLETFVTNAPPDKPRKLQFGLVVFADGTAKQAIPFGDFQAARLREQMNSLGAPSGGTPLGEALQMAWQTVLSSGLTRKHIVVITDGENTVGRDPATVMPRLIRQTRSKGSSVAAHFVAFDVYAAAFNAVKSFGATVLGASDAKQLDSQLEFILEHKILLEDEEPPAAGGAAGK